jgi:CubicO group peptidase (beta-lactamase class C family)
VSAALFGWKQTAFVLVAFMLISGGSLAAVVPITGTGESLTAFDDALLAHLERSHCTAATFALMIDGRVIYARGYGWLDPERTRKTLADTPMRVASISKPITAAAIDRLMAAGQLGRDTKVLPLLKLEPPAAVRLDRRWHDVTVGELLQHKGGWDIKELGFDPMFSGPRAARELILNRKPKPEDMIRWMMSQPLQFDPGARSAYSNFGYCILGRVIESASHRTYLQYVRQEVFRPAGIDPRQVWLAHVDPDKRDPREPEYNQPCNVDIMDAHGGIVIASPTLCKYLDAYRISGEPRKRSEKGYVYTFFGSMPGTSAIAHQRTDGNNFACAFNGRHKGASLEDLTKELNRLVDELVRK